MDTWELEYNDNRMRELTQKLEPMLEKFHTIPFTPLTIQETLAYRELLERLRASILLNHQTVEQIVTESKKTFLQRLLKK